MSVEIQALRKHIGRKRTEEGIAELGSGALMALIFERPEGPPKLGDPMPPGWHWGCLWQLPPRASLGEDGLPLEDEVLPKMPFPRRMFAGGSLAVHRPLRFGQALRRETELTDLSLREGSSGALIFNTMTQRIFGPDGLALVDERHGVFREAVPAGQQSGIPKREAPPAEVAWRRSYAPDVVALFRYSAATFNAHRIHYDRHYNATVEGYPGLVVHGPFVQQCLLDLARDNNSGKTLVRFSIRARAPLFDTAPFTVVGRPKGNGCELWAVTPDGTIASSATAEFA